MTTVGDVRRPKLSPPFICVVEDVLMNRFRWERLNPSERALSIRFSRTSRERSQRSSRMCRSEQRELRPLRSHQRATIPSTQCRSERENSTIRNVHPPGKVLGLMHVPMLVAPLPVGILLSLAGFSPLVVLLMLLLQVLVPRRIFTIGPLMLRMILSQGDPHRQ